MKINQKSQLQYKIQHIIFIVLLLGCIGFAGWLSNEYNFRSDWTEGHRHSLSPQTIQLLQQLPGAINLRSYQPDNAQLTKAITEILNRYKTNKGDFSFQLINPDIFIEQAKTDKIERYGQTLIEYQGRTERIQKLSEEAITNALIRLQRNNQPELVFLSQHGERSIKDDSAIGYSILASKLLEQGFNLSSINLLNQALVVDNKILVMGSFNQPLLKSEQDKLQRYIKNGGNLLWLQDPKPEPTLSPISDDLNIHFIDGVVVDNNQEVSQMLHLSHPAIIPILEYKRHPITEKMQYFTLFTTASAITAGNNNSTSRWNTSDLLITSDTSWAENKGFLLGVYFDKEEDYPGPLSIGIAQQRELSLNDNSIKQRVVIIGDTDFIANNNLGSGANFTFILNTFNWLSQDDTLISIAAKDAPDLELKLTAPVAAMMGLVFLIALPILFFITGATIWFKRRNK